MPRPWGLKRGVRLKGTSVRKGAEPSLLAVSLHLNMSFQTDLHEFNGFGPSTHSLSRTFNHAIASLVNCALTDGENRRDSLLNVPEAGVSEIDCETLDLPVVVTYRVQSAPPVDFPGPRSGAFVYLLPPRFGFFQRSLSGRRQIFEPALFSIASLLCDRFGFVFFRQSFVAPALTEKTRLRVSTFSDQTARNLAKSRMASHHIRVSSGMKTTGMTLCKKRNSSNFIRSTE